MSCSSKKTVNPGYYAGVGIFTTGVCAVAIYLFFFVQDFLIISENKKAYGFMTVFFVGLIVMAVLTGLKKEEVDSHNEKCGY